MRFSSFDVFPKTLQEFRRRTLTGAIISIATATLITLLVGVEFVDFLRVKKDDHLFVDTTRGQTLQINLNVTFPALPCSVISLDTLDLSGNHAPDHMRNIKKLRVDKGGRVMPGEIGGGGRPAPGRRMLFEAHDKPPEQQQQQQQQQQRPSRGRGGPPIAGAGLKLPGDGKLDLRQFGRNDVMLSRLLADLLPTVFDDKAAVAELRQHIGEGCHLEGSLTVNKVAGNFHFSLTQEDHHVLMTVYGQRDQLNVSHIIHSISFGEPYPGMVNPLDHTPKILHEGSGYFQYHIKIVPTIYEPLRGAAVHSNQYSYTELFRTSKELDKLPAVYFHYELSPIMARVTESRRAYSSFLTGLCAIVGGVFTVAGMVDSALHRFSRAVER